MNTNKFKYFLLSGFMLFIALSFTNCDSMDETYRQFIKDGEIVYVGKADSIKTRGGRERIEISWYLLSDPKVKSYKIFWNNGKDSVANTVTKTENVDTVRVMLNNMPEYVYNFDIYMYDEFGNSSIKSSAIGRTYGEYYEGSILNRTYKSLKRINAGIEVVWTAASEEFLFIELEYTNSAGSIVQKTIDRTIEKDTLFSIPVKGNFKYRSAYIPEPNSLDTFYTEQSSINLVN